MQTVQMNFGRRYALMHKILNENKTQPKFLPMIMSLLVLLFSRPTLNFITYIYLLELVAGAAAVELDHFFC